MKFVLLSAVLMTIQLSAACRTTDDQSRAGSSAAQPAGNSGVAASDNSNAAPSKNFASISPQTPPTPTSLNAKPAMNLTSDSQVTSFYCLHALGNNLDKYANDVLVVGKTASNGTYDVDVSDSNGKTHFAVTITNSGDFLTFQSTTSKPSLALKIASSTQNVHNLYAGISTVSYPPSPANQSTSLTCDVSGQFHVNHNEHMAAYHR